MLKDELILVVGLEDNGVFVKAFDAPGQFCSTHQVNCGCKFVLSKVVEKHVLDVMCLSFHGFLSLKVKPEGMLQPLERNWFSDNRR